MAAIVMVKRYFFQAITEDHASVIQHSGGYHFLILIQIDEAIKTISDTGELGYDGPLYDRFLHMTDDMLAPSPMHIKYLSYVYDGFCI